MHADDEIYSDGRCHHCDTFEFLKETSHDTVVANTSAGAVTTIARIAVGDEQR